MSDVTNELAIAVSSYENGKPKITLMGDKNDIHLTVAQAKMLVKILETTILAVDVAYREANQGETPNPMTVRKYEERTAYDEGRGQLTPLRGGSLGDFRPGNYQATTLGQPTPTPQSQTS